ncbi:MAG: hypothetical protein GY768_31965 [Planctomycetaceae bacterium]|nr:hypothetical protein [Planctomycetaceae bacterium]
MHVVIWTLGDNRFATPTRDVVEAISVVDVRSLPSVDPWVCGLINYRGRPIPLVDVSKLLGEGTAKRQLYARILVVKRGAESETEWLGLLVESVLGAESLDFDSAETAPTDTLPPQIPFLGPISLFDRGSIQLTDSSKIPITPNPASNL